MAEKSVYTDDKGSVQTRRYCTPPDLGIWESLFASPVWNNGPYIGFLEELLCDWEGYL
jgi:hypothetical protein